MGIQLLTFHCRNNGKNQNRSYVSNAQLHRRKRYTVLDIATPSFWKSALENCQRFYQQGCKFMPRAVSASQEMKGMERQVIPTSCD